MSDLRAAAQQALVALEYYRSGEDYQPTPASNAITTLKAALAEPAQEPDSPERRCGGPGCDGTCCQPVQEPKPVAWRWGYRSVTTGEMDWRGYVEIPAHPNLRSPEIIMEPLYATPPQRKPLSEDEIFKIENDIPDDVISDRAWTIWFARAIERAHGIKE